MQSLVTGLRASRSRWRGLAFGHVSLNGRKRVWKRRRNYFSLLILLLESLAASHLLASCPRGCFHLVVLGVGAFRVVLRRVPVFAAADSSFKRGISGPSRCQAGRCAQTCRAALVIRPTETYFTAFFSAYCLSNYLHVILIHFRLDSVYHNTDER